jgi:hypothetical protein
VNVCRDLKSEVQNDPIFLKELWQVHTLCSLWSAFSLIAKGLKQERTQ